MPMNKQTDQLRKGATLGDAAVTIRVLISRGLPAGGHVEIHVDRGSGKVLLGSATQQGTSAVFTYQDTALEGQNAYYARVVGTSYTGPFSLAYAVIMPATGVSNGILLEDGGNINDESGATLILES